MLDCLDHPKRYTVTNVLSACRQIDADVLLIYGTLTKDQKVTLPRTILVNQWVYWHYSSIDEGLLHVQFASGTTEESPLLQKLLSVYTTLWKVLVKFVSLTDLLITCMLLASWVFGAWLLSPGWILIQRKQLYNTATISYTRLRYYSDHTVINFRHIISIDKWNIYIPSYFISVVSELTHHKIVMVR